MLEKFGMPLVYIFLVLTFIRPIYGIAFYLAFDFLNPEHYIPGYMDIHMNSIFLCALFIAALLHRRDFKQSKLLLCLLCIAGAAGMSTLVNGVAGNTGGAFYFAQIRIIKCIMLAIILVSYVRTRKEFYIINGAFVFTLAINGIFAIMQCWFGYDSPTTEDVYWGPVRYGGFFLDVNTSGAMNLIFCLPFVYYCFQHAQKKFSRLWFLGLLALSILSVFLTISRSAFLGLIIFGMYVLFKDIKKITPIIIAALLIWGIANVAGDKWTRDTIETRQGQRSLDGSSDVRLTVWKKSFQVFLHNPLFGCGPGNIKSAIRKHSGMSKSQVVGTAHNTYFAILAEWGLAGIIPFLIMQLLGWQALSRLIRQKILFYSEFASYYRAGMLAVLFCSMFFSMNYWPAFWIVFILPIVLEKTYTLECQTSSST